jgi:hypothetical protein
MNILRFDRGGIKELLEAYKTQKSAANWQRIMKRADVNQNRFKTLRYALDQAEANGELVHDFRVAHLLNEFLYGKEGSLYNPLFALREEPPESDVVVDQLLQQARLMDLRKSEIVRARACKASGSSAELEV